MSVQVATVKMADMELKGVNSERPSEGLSLPAIPAVPAIPASVSPIDPESSPIPALSQPMKGAPASAMKRTDPTQRPKDGGDDAGSPEGAVSEAPRTVKKSGPVKGGCNQDSLHQLKIPQFKR